MSKGRLTTSILRLTAAIVAVLVGVIAIAPPSNASAAGVITGVYEIRNSATHKCLSVHCLSVHSGNVSTTEPMEQFRCGRDVGFNWGYQRFQFERIDSSGTGWFLIHPRSNRSLCLGMAPQTGAYAYVDGVALQQQTCAPTPVQSQLFTLQWEGTFDDGNTQNKIVNKLSRKCMQVDGGEHNWADYARISQWSCSNTGNHLNWDFKWLAHS
jgi:hypothetical protein